MINKMTVLALFPAAMAFMAGMMLPFQAASNGAVGKALGHPLWGALVSLVVSLMLLLPLLWLMKVPAPRIGAALQGPWWLWIGGVVGVLYVASAAAFVPRLGAGGFIVLIVAGQMVAAVAIDHYALMNLPPRPIGFTRVAGVLLLLIGAGLILFAGKRAG